MENDAKIYVAGHLGMVGSAIRRRLEESGYTNIVTRSRAELDLCDQKAVRDFFRNERPDYVFLAAAKVGGIHANSTYPGDFILENLKIQTNVIEAAFDADVAKLAFLGSACIYPRLAPQPIPESALLSGPLEATNDAYALAKIAGIKLCQSLTRQYGFKTISLMPNNLYGPGDNFHGENSHVIPALLKKFHAAKIGNANTVTVWGSGSPKREFLHVDDLADAAVFLMENHEDPDIVNVGFGSDLTIKELALLIKDVVGFNGTISFDTSKPEGMPRKLLDCRKIESLGWRPEIPLREGLTATYRWFLEHQADLKS